MSSSEKISAKTLCDQAYEYVKERILNDAFPASQKLPSVRAIAETLCISRNTAERAYQQLLAEGSIRSQEKSGFYVEDFDKSIVIASEKQRTVELHESIEEMGHPYATNPGIKYDFCFTNPAPDIFPIDTWRKLTSAVLYSTEVDMINQYGNPLGDYDLRSALSKYLFNSRGVHCLPEQVVIQTGLGDGFDQLLKLFSSEHDPIILEDPCLSIMQIVTKSNRFQIKPIDVSSSESFHEGLNKTRAKLICVTPSHQFPTGSTMPVSDRVALLEWAKDNDAYIVEDDYDSEFRYGTKAIPSLHALDSSDRVIYTGSFSKTLSPNLRISYWVLPPELLTRYREDYAILPCPAPWIIQRVLYHFIAQGHWDKYLRKYLTLNKKKREALLKACSHVFGDKMELSGQNAGLHVWATLADPRPSSELLAIAREAQVAVYPTEQFYQDKSRLVKNAFILGHSKIKEEDIFPGVQQLYDAWFC